MIYGGKWGSFAAYWNMFNSIFMIFLESIVLGVIIFKKISQLMKIKPLEPFKTSQTYEVADVYLLLDTREHWNTSLSLYTWNVNSRINGF